jgi:hypothetical protein
MKTDKDLAVPAYLVSARRSLCDRLEAAEKGHPKPDLVASIEAELDAFDAKHPNVRGARLARSV